MMKPRHKVTRNMKKRKRVIEEALPIRRSERLKRMQSQTSKPNPISRKRNNTERLVAVARKSSKRDVPTGNQGLTKQQIKGTKATQNEKSKTRKPTNVKKSKAAHAKSSKVKKMRAIKTKRSDILKSSSHSAENNGASMDQLNRGVECKHIITFTANTHFYGDRDLTRFSDAAFLGDDHILVADDGQLSAQSGFRVCCFRLDGTLVADLPLYGMPWTVLPLSPTEAVVTLRLIESEGQQLVWLSINVERGVIECTKTASLEEDAFGVAYNAENGMFVISYHNKSFMTILNREAMDIGKFSVDPDSLVRCVFVGNNIKYLARCGKYIRVVDMVGNEKSKIPFKHPMLSSPTDFEFDDRGNMYAANYEDSINSRNAGNVCLFDAEENYIKTLCKHNCIVGIGLNARTNTMAVAHEQFVSIYKLQ